MRILEILREMAFTRAKFIDDIRDDLRGAFGEYMCREIALSIGKPDSWTNEVTRLSSNIMRYFTVKTTMPDKNKAFREAIEEASICQGKVTYAKNKVAKYYPEHIKQIDQLDFDGEEKFYEMLQEFLPKLYSLAKNA